MRSISKAVSIWQLMALIALTGAWLVPNRYPPWTSFYNDALAALSIAALAASLASRIRIRNLPDALWVVTLIAAIPWLQWLFGLIHSSGDAVIASLYILGLAAAIGVGQSWARVGPVPVLESLFIAIITAAVISALLGLNQVLQLVSLGIWTLDFYPGMRAFANLGQSNNLASLLGLAVVGVIYLFETGRIFSLTLVALTGLLSLGIAASQSRTALLFVPTIILGIWWGRRAGIRFKTRIAWLLLLSTGLAALTFLWPTIQDALLLQPAQSFVERASGQGLRLQMWTGLLEALSTSPWFGFGWMQTGEALLVAAENRVAVEFWLNAHNLFIDLLIWCGYPLGLLISLLVLGWYFRRLGQIRSREALVSMICVSLIGIHSMVEFPYQYGYLIAPLGLFIGQIELDGEGGRARIDRRWNIVPFSLAAVLLLGVLKDYPSVEDDFRLMRFQTLGIGSAAASEAVEAPFLGTLTQFLAVSRTLPAAGQDRLAQTEAVARRYPYAPSLYHWALELTLNGNKAEAKAVMGKLRNIHGAEAYDTMIKDLRLRAETDPVYRELEQTLL